MDQELKQRLIGAVVITALAAIFVPMLFDDPVDESGQVVNELELPDAPIKSFDETARLLPSDSIVEREENEELSGETENLETVDEERIDEAGDELEPLAEEPVDDVGFEPEPFVEEPIYQVEAEPEPSISKTTDKSKSSVPEKSVKQEPIAKPLEPRPEHKPTVPDSIADGWYIQLGSFSKRDNAYSLRDKLRSQGFAALVDEVATGGGKSYRLVVGPEHDKGRALATQKKLDQLNHTKSLLMAVGQAGTVQPDKTAAITGSVAKAGTVPSQTGSALVRWYIQLGSFSKRDNAYSLRDKLRSQGYPVTIDEVDTPNGKSFRLRAGPELDKKRAETMQAEIERQNRLKSLLVSE